MACFFFFRTHSISTFLVSPSVDEKVTKSQKKKNIYIYNHKRLEIRLADISSLLVKDFVRATDQAARAVTIYTLIGNVRRSTVKILGSPVGLSSEDNLPFGA